MSDHRRVLMALAATALAACQPGAPPAEPSATVEAVEPAPAEAMDFAMPYTVKVAMSPAAAAKLAETEERVTLSAYYYGEPKDETVAADVEGGDPGVWLGTEELQFEGADYVMPVPGSFQNNIAAEKVMGGVRALVNVYSSRIAHADNILSCNIIDESLEVLSEMPEGATITCTLIGE